MTRPLRIEIPGGIYHVVSRGHSRESIYRDDQDRLRWLRMLGETSERLDWVVIAYCLMDNHFHLLVQTPTPNLARGMQSLNGSYAQSFNRRHGRDSSLFGRRYHGPLIQGDSHVLATVRYIALNPVRAGLAVAPEDYRWSSYPLAVGSAVAPPWFALDALLDWFDSSRAALRAFVEGSEDVAADRGAVRGDTHFARKVLPETRAADGISWHHWDGIRPTLESLFASEHGDHVIAAAHLHFRYTLVELARFLGCSERTCARAVKRHESRARKAS